MIIQNWICQQVLKNNRVVLVLLECTWNDVAVSFVLLAFDNTVSLGSPPCQLVYPSSFMVPP